MQPMPTEQARTTCTVWTTINGTYDGPTMEENRIRLHCEVTSIIRTSDIAVLRHHLSHN